MTYRRQAYFLQVPAKSIGIPLDEAEKGKSEPIERPAWLSSSLDVIHSAVVKSSAQGCLTSGIIDCKEVQMEMVLFNAASGESSWMSNFSAHPISWAGKTFLTCEHAYQWGKLFRSAPRNAARVLAAPTASGAKARGKQGQMDPCWNDTIDDGTGRWAPKKVHAMRRILRRKLEQNPELTEKLIATKNIELVHYCPWGDRFWGVDKNKVGENWLGKLWMGLRGELQ